MQYVFNPRNRQINPVTPQTFVDPTLRDKAVSAELYALVRKGKVAIDDIAAIFAVNKSPEILVKNHKAVKQSPIAAAPENTGKLDEGEGKEGKEGTDGDGEGAKTPDANGAFDARELCAKTAAELVIIANTIGIDTSAEGFAPTRGNLIKAIRAKAEQAEKAAGATPPAAPAPTGEPPAQA